MKINTDVFSVNDTKKELNSQSQRSSAKNTDNNVDTVTIKSDKEFLVTEENKSAAKTAFKDIRQVEEAVGEVKEMLSKDFDTASEIHQLGKKSLVNISQD
jgi:DNA-binding protein H-NS